MESPPSRIWDRVAEFTKAAQDKGLDPLAWAVHVSSAIGREGVVLPSPDLARLLVSHICWENNVPAAWKYLEQALAAGMAPPVLVIALLSTRVIPSRHVRVGPYRLYMEILKRHLFEFASQVNGPNFEKILMLVDDVLHLSQNFGVKTRESGVLLVEFVFSITWQLLDAALDDEGLLDLSPRKMSRWIDSSREMEIDGDCHFLEKRSELSEKLLKANTVMAIELIGMFINHKVISRLLFLAHQNMPLCWEDFSRSVHLLAENSLELKNSTLSPETLLNFSSDNLKKICKKRTPCQLRYLCSHTRGQRHGASQSALWIPLDLYLEDAIVGSLAATDAIEVISCIVKSLQAINWTTWHDAFIGLWMAALRVVQRERDPIEGPVPHLETRMCMLLSITTLSVSNIIEEEESSLSVEIESEVTNQLKERITLAKCREALVSSLQVLGDYESLLIPPQSLVSVANHAALKAMVFVSGLPLSSGYIESIGMDEKIARCSGNLRHLIVEACIARNLLDTSAYFWPGYITGHVSQIPQCINTQGSSWSALMMGAPLTSSLTSVLMSTPARSLAELEKIFDIATNGLGDERVFAASVLCGASLLQGWNLQEHTVRFVVKLLSPPIPDGYSESDSHLISYAPVLDVVLSGISSVDCAQVFSLYGLVPELAAALMPVCEVFGSCIPNTSWTLPSGEHISVHSVFSIAFIFLLRLWEFNHTPIEYCIVGESPPVGSQLTPEYLLLLRNSNVMHSCGEVKKRSGNRSTTNAASVEPIFVDMFPKLKTWYRQHQACLASTLSDLVPGTSVHQTVDCLLNMMFKKINKGSGQTVGSELSGSSMSGSTITGSEDTSLRPMLPAWDIMQAVPYVIDSALTACAHGRMSPRELATGLKDLADFLPSSLATIVSYFSAEVTRGVWKPAHMNGTDWPSPAANLSTVEEHIKNIVAATGVDVPSLAKVANTPATLSLPLAAFVSLTITYKLDKASERFLNLAGPALENLSASCPWPSMPIVAALWTQKVKRWSDFLTFSASRTVFHQNNNTAVQLLKSCFAATLGLSTMMSSGNGGVGSLLGHGFGSHFSGGLSPVAPGILYLQVYRSIRDTLLLTEEILSLLIFSVREVASSILSTESREKLKKSRHRMRYGQVSYVTSLRKVKVAATLGATLVWLAGGSGLVQRLFREILPSWFLNLRCSDQVGSQGMVAMLEGSALAYFAILSAMFSWGIGSTPLSKRRPKVIGIHLDFLADALEEKISLGCNWATWRAYVLEFLGLMVDCAPNWVLDTEINVLKRLSRGLRQWNEEELALLLLGKGGWRTMGAAAELVVANEL